MGDESFSCEDPRSFVPLKWRQRSSNSPRLSQAMPLTFISPFHAYKKVRAVIAPTPSLIVSASRDGTVRSWQFQQNEVVNPLLAKSAPTQADTVDMNAFKQHHGYVTSLAYHPDGISFWTPNERIGDKWRDG